MAFQEQPQWRLLFLILLVFTILIQSLISEQTINTPLLQAVSAAPTILQRSNTNTIETNDNYNEQNASHPFDYSSNHRRNSEDDHQFSFRREAKTAQTTCSSDIQYLGPNWSGTFQSNSQDGVYPSISRSCTWVIQAMSATNSGDSPIASPFPSPTPTPSPTPPPLSSSSSSFLSSSSSPSSSPSKQRNLEALGLTGSPYVISLSFGNPIQIVCGIDSLTLYDGPDSFSPVIATLCGVISTDGQPMYYSSGPQMTAVFTTQSTSPGSLGFSAYWSSVLPYNVCTKSGRGVSNANGGCICNANYTGSVCQYDAPQYQDFSPRSQHSMAYDSAKDIAYITGGTSSDVQFFSLDQIITYAFATNKWGKINASARSLSPRYGHFSFMFAGNLFFYGGVTNIGPTSEIWGFDGKAWLRRPIGNPDQPGRAGPACVLVTMSNSTRLFVFGGLTDGGEIRRDLNIFNFNTNMWERVDHQNSVGLFGATAVYHKATESIYYFGGMVNQTVRNVITYQYVIQQQLWYALAPRVDPFTSPPVPLVYPSGSQQPNIPDFPGSIDGSSANSLLPPVWYDSISSVWSPAQLMGDDFVVFYGGMKPYGPGLSLQDQSCYTRKLTIYDISCQNWTSFDFYDQYNKMKPRVNHTMVLRPPKAAGGSETAWTAYIFGGYDGRNHQDMVSLTLNIPTTPSDTTNNCRALRWCNMYDDCQNCNSNYCSYIDGLCLFDVSKAKQASAPANSPNYLVGSAVDIPQNGTLQDLLAQQPGLVHDVVSTEQCPTRVGLDLGALYSKTMQPGEEIVFKTYIDAISLDVQFDIQTNQTTPVTFSSLNVWEGYMNMYWRADHGLTDYSWNGESQVSTPIPSDLPKNSNLTDGSVITLSGILNTTELLNRWRKYSGLDNSPSYSAFRQTTHTAIQFNSEDPRRFSGYYVYSIKNLNTIPLTFSLVVSTLNHEENTDTESKFDLATLGFVMAGFIILVLVSVLAAMRVRRIMRRREAIRIENELRLIEEREAQEEEEEERRRMANLILNPSESRKDMKPMYRVVLSVQPDKKAGFYDNHNSLAYIGVGSNNLRHRSNRRANLNSNEKSNPSSAIGDDSDATSISRLHASNAGDDELKSLRARSDIIRDLGSTSESSRFDGNIDSSSDTVDLEKPRSLFHSNSSVHSSLRRESLAPMEVTLSEQGSDNFDLQSERRFVRTHHIPESSVDSDHDVIELDVLTPGNVYGPADVPLRNPLRVQPISIEPLPFHGGLVPRTPRNFKRYQRSISVSKRRPIIPRPSSLQSNSTMGIRPRNSLRRAKSTATRLTQGSRPGSPLGLNPPLTQDQWEGVDLSQHRPKSKGYLVGRKEYEPGPLLAMNVLIAFPGDTHTKSIIESNSTGLDDLTGSRYIPPLAIGTIFAPDPVRWWAYKARQQHDARRLQKEMERLQRYPEQYSSK